MTRCWLVTGANGFIGRALCATLAADGCRVRALLRRPQDGPWSESLCCDLGREPVPAAACAGIAGIFHLAGLAHMQDASGLAESVYQRVNVEGTAALLEAAHAADVQGFVYFSSVKAAADPGADCVDERWDAAPADAYGRSKRDAEDLVLAAADHLHVCVLRPTLVYGPGVKGNLARMIQAIRAGRFPPLPELGNRRSMVSRADLLRAARLAMDRPQARGKRYIVADGVDYSTVGLSAAIRAALGKAEPAWRVPWGLLRLGAGVGDLLSAVLRAPMPLSSAVLHRLCDSACYRADRLRSELGWAPTDTFYSALPAICAGLTRGPEANPENG